MKTTINTIFRKLKHSGISKGDVATRTNFSQGYLSHVINGTKPLTKKFAEAFLSEFASFFTGEEVDFINSSTNLDDSTAQLNNLIDRIQTITKLTRDKMAERLNYTGQHFSMMKKSNPERLQTLLLKEFSEDLSGKTKSHKGMSQSEALVLALMYDYAEFKAIHLKELNSKAIIDQLFEKAEMLLAGQRITAI